MAKAGHGTGKGRPPKCDGSKHPGYGKASGATRGGQTYSSGRKKGMY